MKNRGFTLIELVGTIIVLAVITLVALPATLSMLNHGQKTADDSVKEIVKSAANKYVSEHKNESQFSKALGESKKDNGVVYTSKLKDEGYLADDIYDKYELIGSCVLVTSNNQKYFYEFKENC